MLYHWALDSMVSKTHQEFLYDTCPAYCWDQQFQCFVNWTKKGGAFFGSVKKWRTIFLILSWAWNKEKTLRNRTSEEWNLRPSYDLLGFYLIFIGLELLNVAIAQAGYTGKIKIGMDVAASGMV